jgi:glucoamylase
MTTVSSSEGLDASQAPGWPGAPARWTHSTKEGIGTSYHTSCHLWFTLSHGIVNELYYPTIDRPNTRDFGLLITDGATFCHEEKRDLEHEVAYPEKHCLLYRLTNTDPGNRYRIVKDICCDPHRSVLLMRARLEILDESLRGKLRVYALLAPHLGGGGAGNSAWTCEFAGREIFHASRDDLHLSFASQPDFTRRSVGFVGTSDGWQDLMDNFRMDWEYRHAENGNVALCAELDPAADEWMLGVGIGASAQSAATKVLQCLAQPFDELVASYVRQWQRTELAAALGLDEQTGDDGHILRLSRCLLLAHEDKQFQGALIASLSIPWGEIKGDDDLGGYHLVWTRDLVQSATALLATGQTHTPLRALIWLACVQKEDGSFPQNSWIDGQPYWKGLQLDELAAPILLAWRLRRADALEDFDPWHMIASAARFLMLQGPVTGQERWEEQPGYSPSTLAPILAGLVAAADFGRGRADADGAPDFILAYTDWLNAHLEEWTVTSRGELVPGQPRHYLRITPADPQSPDPHPDPDTLEIQLANGGGRHPARNVVGTDFLHLVRFGLRAPDDPLVLSSLAVSDAVLKCALPQGDAWRRYNHDGYGQKADGGAFDGAGCGGAWPLLTGERGHYELVAKRDPLPSLRTMEKMANVGGMLPEQIWWMDDLPDGKFKRGDATGSAMPLCWSHAEYISLVRSRRDGEVFDRVEPAYRRYVVERPAARFEIWTPRHQTRQIPAGRILRLVLPAKATCRWTADGWQKSVDTAERASGLPNLWFIDLPTDALAAGATLEFTLRWDDEAGERWEGKNFAMTVNV